MSGQKIQCLYQKKKKKDSQINEYFIFSVSILGNFSIHVYLFHILVKVLTFQKLKFQRHKKMWSVKEDHEVFDTPPIKR